VDSRTILSTTFLDLSRCAIVDVASFYCVMVVSIYSVMWDLVRVQALRAWSSCLGDYHAMLDFPRSSSLVGSRYHNFHNRMGVNNFVYV